MKMIVKRLGIMILIATVAASFCSCGASSGKDESGPIKLGLVADLSGSSANTQTVNSINLAVEEINDNGGILGRQVEVDCMDGQSDTARYQEMGKKLILQDNVDVLFTAGNSACREALRPVAEENKMLYYYCNSYEGGVASRYMMMCGPVPEQTVDPLLQYASENVGKKIYCLVADYNYGRVMTEWVKQKAPDYGMEVVGEEYVPMEVSQFSSSIAKIQQSGADLVFIAMVGSNQESFFDQWGSADVEGTTLMSLNNFCQYYEHKKLSPPVLEGSLTATAYMEEFNTEASKEFVEKYRKEYPDEPYLTSNCNIAYNAVYLWKEAVEAAGSVDVEDVIDAIETKDIEFNGPGGMVKIEPKTHHVYSDISVVQIDAEHNANIVKTYEQIAPTYLLDMGIDLSKDDPQTQYTPLDDSE